MKKRVTVIIALLACLVLAVCLFAACNDGGSTGQQIPGGNRPGAETPNGENSGIETPGENLGDNPGNNPGGEDPGTDEPGDSPDGEEQDPDGGQNPSGDEPETLEPTEEDYRLQNFELLKEILAREYHEFSLGKYVEFELTDISEIIINKTVGTIHFQGNRVNKKSTNPTSESLLFEGKFVGENGELVTINCETQKEFNNFLNQNHDMVFELGSPMLNFVSETTYAEFVDWAKEQNYGEVDFSDVPDDDVFGVTWFYSDPAAWGNRYIAYKIVKANQVYTIHLENVDPLGSPDTQIKELMKWKNSVFKIVDVKPFEEFDINTEIKDIA